MPGFNVAGSGGAPEAGVGTPSNQLEMRRKHRWVFQSVGDSLSSDILIILREAQRPSFTFEEAVMDHNQESAYFAGRQKWEPIKMVFYDAEQPTDSSAGIWGWLNSVVTVPTAQVFRPDQYKKNGILNMINGQGGVNETWNMYGCWPAKVNFSDLNYTNNEIQVVEVDMRFDRAVRG